MVKRAVEYYGKRSFVKSIYEKYGIDKEEYARLLDKVLDEAETSMIRRSTITGRPIGPEPFWENIAINFGVDLRPRPRGRPRKRGK